MMRDHRNQLCKMCYCIRKVNHEYSNHATNPNTPIPQIPHLRDSHLANPWQAYLISPNDLFFIYFLTVLMRLSQKPILYMAS